MQVECSDSSGVWRSSLLPVSVSADVCQPVVLVSVLLWILWGCHEQLLGAHPLQLDLHLGSTSHLRRPGPGPGRRDSDESARALPDGTVLEGECVPVSAHICVVFEVRFTASQCESNK